MTTNEEQQDGSPNPNNADAASTGTSGQAAAGSGSAGGTPTGYVTEDAYKGYQRAAEKQKAKLEADIAALKTKSDEAHTQLEEAKMALSDKEKLEQEKAKLASDMAAMQAERDSLARKLNQQKIILAEFPVLAPLANYVPAAETDDDYRASARQFAQALEAYNKQTTINQLQGASPNIQGGNGSADSGALDALWDAVYATAGIPGKEKEYQEANAKLQAALKPA